MSATPSNQNVIPIIKKESIISLFDKGIRQDGRKLNEYRPISITVDYAKKADGSALVKLGNTMVLAGVKLELGKPYEDTPNQGNLIVNVELLPLAYETFEPGPPDENAIELARVIDRSLRDSKAIDLTKLVIEPGKSVWTVWLDVYVLDYNGNVLDACMLASIAALYNTSVYKVEQSNGSISINKSEKIGKLPMNYPVVSVSLGKVDKYLVVDPDLEEESIIEAKISFSYTADYKIVGIQKSGKGSLLIQDIDQAENIARVAAAKLIEELKKQLNI
ncbi:exonuclease [Sulfolobus sp. A20]|uniref:exosome complex protein Rrp42 n=1 Tax=Sulfolobaceae TaxID=118883 RepID=UPI000845F2B9|nr:MULTISPECIES: exosome complex protein Rrp42 [unclassified Sulfolobus]TRM74546.1 exosome complex component Rrp42 [Sulfolobus sp. E5]TRM74762.1 exosome complex component Rrp42 [Sulfolobus sp. A20-N-F8]TRM85598.1 exosome complex component Rrp42 [Sulfolobus sp. F3]TRM85920.1 exosome complex component Rrp42 [Sulfolobus sp. E3]TRM98682.1 exosome complex component Rrp42 [Sulfolobus sp. F1]TRN00099.1 exosome complex component Rrp42 [Sulfolobus sp. E1]